MIPKDGIIKVYQSNRESLHKLLSKDKLSKADYNMIEALKYILAAMEKVYDLDNNKKRSQTI